MKAAWSPDGHYLAINHSTGRSKDCQLYRLAEHRAVPVKLPAPEDHPKGKVLAVLFASSPSGGEFRWQDNQTLIEQSWGRPFKPDSTDEEESKYRFEYGLPPNFEGRLEYIYKRKGLGGWSIVDVRPEQHP